MNFISEIEKNIHKLSDEDLSKFQSLLNEEKVKRDKEKADERKKEVQELEKKIGEMLERYCKLKDIEVDKNVDDFIVDMPFFKCFF